MKSFNQFLLSEEAKDPSSKTFHAFDIDETLFAHDHDKVKIHVKDKKSGKRIASLSNQEYNTNKLHPDHEYDYSDFRSSDVFQKSAKPIRSMIAKMKAIHKNNKNVEMVTARSDLDDKNKFAHHMKKYGIDIGKIHVRRSGNLDSRAPAAKNKADMISSLIKQNDYQKVHLYDDSKENLDHFKALKLHHPGVEFHAHHIDHDPKTGRVKITSSRA